MTSAFRRSSPRAFWTRLAPIVGGALVLRVLYVLIVTRHENNKLYDAFWYGFQSLALADGHFFPILFGPPEPDAAHPPLTALVLTPASYLFGLRQGTTPQRLTMALLGAVVLLLTALLGRELAGDTVGLVAAVVAALYPEMWMPSGILMSETLTMLVAAWILLGVYRLLRSPSWGNAALVGVSCGVEMLVRAEMVLLVPLLLVPCVMVAGTSWKNRLALGAVGIGVACVIVGPWVGRNLVSFRDTTLLSNGEGPVLAGANCSQTYSGPGLGAWSLPCSLDVHSNRDQSVITARQSKAGERYAEHHLARLPIVVLARVGRVWDFYQPVQMAHVDVNEGRPFPASVAGFLSFYALLPAGLLGVVNLRRKGVRVWPLLAIAAAVTITAAAGYGLVRFRAEFEVPLVVLAATGVVASADWIRSRGLRRQHEKDDPQLARSVPPP